jgi:hypothetical protein
VEENGNVHKRKIPLKKEDTLVCNGNGHGAPHLKASISRTASLCLNHNEKGLSDTFEVISKDKHKTSNGSNDYNFQIISQV